MATTTKCDKCKAVIEKDRECKIRLSANYSMQLVDYDLCPECYNEIDVQIIELLKG